MFTCVRRIDMIQMVPLCQIYTYKMYMHVDDRYITNGLYVEDRMYTNGHYLSVTTASLGRLQTIVYVATWDVCKNNCMCYTDNVRM